MLTFKISSLPTGSSLIGTELVPVVQSSLTVHVTVTQVNEASPDYLAPMPVGPTFYLRTVPQTVTITTTSPAVVTWSSHGLQANDPVVFSLPLDRGICTISTATPAVVTLSSHGYTNNDPIGFTAIGDLPSPVLASSVSYYVANSSVNTFEFSSVQGSSSISLASTTTGTYYVQRNSVAPSGLLDGQICYVIPAGLAGNSFEYSLVLGGSAAGLTSTGQGRIVGQTGNDNNDGSSQTRDGACLTLIGLYNKVTSRYQFNGQNVFFQFADGTYRNYNGSSGHDAAHLEIMDGATFNSAYTVLPWSGYGNLSIIGSTANPDAVRVLGTAGSAGCFVTRTTLIQGNLNFRGFRINSGFSDAFSIAGGFSVSIKDCHFEACAAPIGGLRGGTNITIDGAHQLLTSPSGGSAIVSANGARVFLEFLSELNAVGTIDVPHGIYDLTDDRSIPSYLQNGGMIFGGNWTGVKWRVAYNNLIAQFFTSSGLGLTPDTLTAGTVAPAGIYWETNSPYNATKREIGCVVDAYYNFQSIASSGFSVTANHCDGHIVIDSSVAISSGTLVLTSAPIDGQTLNVRAGQAITTLSVEGSTGLGHTIIGAPSSLNAGESFDLIFRSTNLTWYCG